MAALNGQITALGLYGADDEENWSIDLSGFVAADYLDLSISYAGLTTLTQMRVIIHPQVPSSLIAGIITGYYVNDFYNRIYIAPNPLSLGNLLNDIAEYVYVWNAFFTPKILSAVTEYGTDGIQITHPYDPPTTFAALEERTYTITTLVDGPPTIAATVSFVFDGTAYPLSIIGTRVVLWKWRPEMPYIERLEWLTQILKTRQGEQRICLRGARQVFDLSFKTDPHEFSSIKTAGMEWVFRSWGLAIWSEQTKISSLLAGATQINFSTLYADYRDGGLAVLWESDDKMEAVEIDTVRDDGLDLARSLSQNWSNAIIMPLRLVRTPDGINITRTDKTTVELSAAFVVTDNVDLSAGASYPQYRGYDVLTDGDLIMGNVAERIVRPVVSFDNGQGQIVAETSQDWTNFSRTLGKSTHNKASRWTWRKWLHARYGRQKSFWLPTWNQDMTVNHAIGSADTSIMIDPIGISISLPLPVDIMIKTTSGTIYYRRVLEAYGGVGYESITIDAVLGASLAITDIAMVCFLNLVRLNSDKVEIHHGKPYRTTTSIPVIEVPEAS